MIRPLRREDAGPLLDMWNATARFDPLNRELLDEKVWEDPEFDEEAALVCESDGQITGFVMAVPCRAHDDSRGVVKLLAVAAGRRRQGVGSRLLDSAEAVLARRGARTIRVFESPPNYLTPGVDCRYSSAPYFLEKHGYQRIGQACNMTVDLEDRSFETAAEDAELARQGIEIRRAGEADRDAVVALLEEHWPPWRQEVDNSLRNRPCSLHLALEGGEVIAFSAFDANNRGTGWFGPMGTDPAARKQGIGHVLLFRCLEDIAAQGHRYATIPWVDPVDFYSQCAGAAVSRIFSRYEKVL